MLDINYDRKDPFTGYFLPGNRRARGVGGSPAEKRTAKLNRARLDCGAPEVVAELFNLQLLAARESQTPTSAVESVGVWEPSGNPDTHFRRGISGCLGTPGAAGISRTDVIKAMAAEAEREGWITRERERYGGVYNYALTEDGRNVYRGAIKPQRDAFVEDCLKAREATSAPSALDSAVPMPDRPASGYTDIEARTTALQKLYEKGGSLPSHKRPGSARRSQE